MGTPFLEQALTFCTIVLAFLTVLNAYEQRKNKNVQIDQHKHMNIVDIVTQCSCPDMCPRCGEPVTVISCPDENWHRVECNGCHLSMMTHDKQIEID